MPPRDAPGRPIDTIEGLQSMVEEVTDRDQKPLIFIDLEGVNLSRDGAIAIMQVLVPPKPMVYRLDIHVLQHVAFETPTVKGTTWKEILESDSYAKIFFDVRNDSDALFTHYGVKLRGVIDLQLLEFATRPGYNRPRFVKGLSKCISESGILTWQEARTWEQAKEDGRRQFAPEVGGSYDVFLRRPLSSAMQQYCIEDVLQLPPLLAYYARKINRHLAAQVAAATLARITLSQSPTYNPHGREKAIGPTIRWQSTDPAAVLTFPMSLVCSHELKGLCWIDHTASNPEPLLGRPVATASETVAKIVPNPSDEIDKLTEFMGGASIAPVSESNGLVSEDTVPCNRLDDEEDGLTSPLSGGMYGEHGSYSDDDAGKDFTACSGSDCGWCGHCDY